ncbi:MAG TPA: ABC transporter permease [Pseudobdellovibrionaceae bacterium]|nr:ABC transporter permease [Pseudobdellovibrionaceae bacterium]
MKKILTISRMTILEIIHEKIFFVFVFLSILLILLSALLGNLSFDEQQKIMADFGYLAAQISGLGVSLFFGAYVISREIERQTCLLILSRPLSRTEFIFGKFIGISGINTLLFSVLFVVLGLLLNLNETQLWINHLFIFLLLWIEVLIVLALAMLFSLVVRPLISLLMAFSIYMLGAWIPDLFYFAKSSKSIVFKFWVDLTDWIVPNFYKFNKHSHYYLMQGMDFSKTTMALIYGMAWVLILLVLIRLIFRRKDVV